MLDDLVEKADNTEESLESRIERSMIYFDYLVALKLAESEDTNVE
tara:strand:+ start:67 stop:201 length:135 start_codon:yes stop_codon:yes gene_type:complete